MVAQSDRIYGALLGLAYGDATGFPSLFHRFQHPEIPRRRHDFLWRTNQELDAQNIITLTLPFTHRVPGYTLEPSPTDDTEFALFTLQGLLDGPDEPTHASLLGPWLTRALPVAAEVRSGFSVRAALENLACGERPPATGNDNPVHYADEAVARAVPMGLFFAGNPDSAFTAAGWEASITQAEDGIYAAQAMAVAVAVLAGGGDLNEAVGQARAAFPRGTWIAHGDQIARRAREEATTPEELALLLSTRLINTVYSYGNAAPETLPAALALVEAADGDLLRACAAANLIPKSTDSLPAMVGALCGARRGPDAIAPAWRGALDEARGLCLPFLAGTSVRSSAQALARRIER